MRAKQGRAGPTDFIIRLQFGQAIFDYMQKKFNIIIQCIAKFYV